MGGTTPSMFRLAFVLTIVAIGAAYAVTSPFYALLLYLWVAYFRPDYWIGWMDLIWQLRLSLVTGTFALLYTAISGQKPRFNAGSILWLLFFALSYLAVETSLESEFSWYNWRNFAPAMIFGYLIVVLVTNERQLRLTLLVIAFSLAFEAAKQGWVELLTSPGRHNENDHLMLGDNNGMAVGLLMIIPVLVALSRTASSRMERLIDRFLAVGLLYRALTTYSRGGFLACGALGLHYLSRSKRKMPALVAVVLVGALIAPLLPSAFWDRMRTIRVTRAELEAEETDSSIRSRLHYWRVALEMAADRPLTGVGFAAFMATYNRYDFSNGQWGHNKAVHSSWLGLVAEMGFPGLIVFLALLALAFRACYRARRLAARDPEFQRVAGYATAIEAGLLVFVVGGSFVHFHITEMMWHYIALSIVINQLVDERYAKLAAAEAATRPRLSLAPRLRPVAAASAIRGRPIVSRLT